MFNFATEAFSPKEQIVARFKEYDTLRSEIATRTAGIYQMTGMSLTAAIFLFSWWSSGTQQFGAAFWLALVSFGLLVVIFLMNTRRDFNKIANRIKFIEGEVNRLAGAKLLEWETSSGAASTGWWRL